jgi:hypothetical protein
MGELKHIRISSLKSLIVASLAPESEEACKALVGAFIRFLIPQNGLKTRKILGWNYRGVSSFFFKKLKQTITHRVFSKLLLYFCH